MQTIFFTIPGFIMYVAIFLVINIFIADEKVRQGAKDVLWWIKEFSITIAVIIICLFIGERGRNRLNKRLQDEEYY